MTTYKQKAKEWAGYWKSDGMLIGSGAIIGGVIAPPIIGKINTTSSWLEGIWPDAPICLKSNAVFGSLMLSGITTALAIAIFKKYAIIAKFATGVAIGSFIYAIGKCIVPDYFIYSQRANAAAMRPNYIRLANGNGNNVMPLTPTTIPYGKVLA